MRHGLGRDTNARAAGARGEELEEAMRQESDVLSSLPQLWNFNRDDVQTVEQVLPECSLLDQVCEVLIRGGDDADVHFDVLGSTHPANDVILKEAQQFHLEQGAHLRHFIQEHRAAPGRL